VLSWLLPAAAAVAVVWIAAAGGIGAALGRRPEGDERHPVVTSDGWTLTLHRLRPASAVPADEPPIILGHGLMMNAACWSLSPKGDVARSLAAQGFDVWIAEYRSTDSALPPDGDDTPGRWDYELEDIARCDLPAIIDAVRALTGAARVSWVGHSMGGIVIYRYTAQYGSDALHRVVTMGTPVRFGHLAKVPPLGLIKPVTATLRALRSTSLRGLAQFGLPAMAVHAQPFVYFASNGEFNTRREQLTLARHAVQDNAARIPSWFFDRMQSGEPQSSASVGVPLLVLGGTRDRLAPPSAVHPAFVDARAPVAGVKVYGEGVDEPTFGHADLISSEAAVRVVVPDLVAWLAGADPELRGGRVKRSEGPSAPLEQ